MADFTERDQFPLPYQPSPDDEAEYRAYLDSLGEKYAAEAPARGAILYRLVDGTPAVYKNPEHKRGGAR
jgi:hypothetical protein